MLESLKIGGGPWMSSRIPYTTLPSFGNMQLEFLGCPHHQWDYVENERSMQGC